MPGCEALLARPIQFLRVGRLGNVMRSDEILHKHGKNICDMGHLEHASRTNECMNAPQLSLRSS